MSRARCDSSNLHHELREKKHEGFPTLFISILNSKRNMPCKKHSQRSPALGQRSCLIKKRKGNTFNMHVRAHLTRDVNDCKAIKTMSEQQRIAFLLKTESGKEGACCCVARVRQHQQHIVISIAHDVVSPPRPPYALRTHTENVLQKIAEGNSKRGYEATRTFVVKGMNDKHHEIVVATTILFPMKETREMEIVLLVTRRGYESNGISSWLLFIALSEMEKEHGGGGGGGGGGMATTTLRVQSCSNIITSSYYERLGFVRMESEEAESADWCLKFEGVIPMKATMRDVLGNLETKFVSTVPPSPPASISRVVVSSSSLSSASSGSSSGADERVVEVEVVDLTGSDDEVEIIDLTGLDDDDSDADVSEDEWDKFMLKLRV